MKYLEDVHAAASDPKRLEDLYQTARRQGEAAEFAADLQVCYNESPANVLYAAWYYRLQQTISEEPAERRGVHWKLAILLSLLSGLLLWLLSDPHLDLFRTHSSLMLFWAPLATLLVLTFLTLGARKHYGRTLLAAAGLLAVTGYIVLLAWWKPAHAQGSYLDLMTLHLPLLSWVAVGISLVGLRSSAASRFAFLSKSIEAFVTGGVYLIAVGFFVLITNGLFTALNVSIPDLAARLLYVGGAGLLPVLAVATVYDPAVSPADQEFRRGLGKIIAILMRLLLPLTLVVLLVYLVVIPFNFMQPFRNRDVLIIYNVMLFAIMGLLVGATPLHGDDLPPKQQTPLHLGILILVILVVLVSLYALSAVIYRTVEGGITMNRLTVIGWDSINTALLVLLFYRLLRRGGQDWVQALHSVFSLGAIGYTVWGLFLTLAIPWLFY